MVEEKGIHLDWEPKEEISLSPLTMMQRHMIQSSCGLGLVCSRFLGYAANHMQFFYHHRFNRLDRAGSFSSKAILDSVLAVNSLLQIR